MDNDVLQPSMNREGIYRKNKRKGREKLSFELGEHGSGDGGSHRHLGGEEAVHVADSAEHVVDDLGWAEGLGVEVAVESTTTEGTTEDASSIAPIGELGQSAEVGLSLSHVVEVGANSGVLEATGEGAEEILGLGDSVEHGEFPRNLEGAGTDVGSFGIATEFVSESFVVFTFTGAGDDFATKLAPSGSIFSEGEGASIEIHEVVGITVVANFAHRRFEFLIDDLVFSFGRGDFALLGGAAVDSPASTEAAGADVFPATEFAFDVGFDGFVFSGGQLATDGDVFVSVVDIDLVDVEGFSFTSFVDADLRSVGKLEGAETLITPDIAIGFANGWIVRNDALKAGGGAGFFAFGDGGDGSSGGFSFDGRPFTVGILDFNLAIFDGDFEAAGGGDGVGFGVCFELACIGEVRHSGETRDALHRNGLLESHGQLGELVSHAVELTNSLLSHHWAGSHLGDLGEVGRHKV